MSPFPTDVVAAVRDALLRDPRVLDVELVGSRARGDTVPLSDWDFVLHTDDPASVAAALPGLVDVLDPIARQWDRLGPPSYSCFMLMLPGARKIDLILDLPHDLAPAWVATRDTLVPIDEHFWDWILWLASKRQRGEDGLVDAQLAEMHEHLLEPLGVAQVPRSLHEAIGAYQQARDAVAATLGVVIPRRLEEEVLPAIVAAGTR
jgi:hypothetical protein